MGNKMKGMAFSEPMILALLNTKPNHWPPVAIDESKPFKSQTRREHGLKDFNKDPDHALFHPAQAEDGSWIFWYPNPVSDAETAKRYKDGGIKPRYKVGEIVYCKEAIYRGLDNMTLYQAGGDHWIGELYGETLVWNWKPSKLAAMYMPHDLHRMELEIKAVRVERLQDITEADAVAEGIEHLFSAEEMSESPEMMVYANSWKNYLWHGHDGLKKKQVDSWPHQFSSYQSAVKSYSSLWESISGPGSWDSNPWVFAYEFARVK